MADNTLQFETRVNLSGLNAGMDQATAKIQDLGKSTVQALTPAQQAVQNLTDAQIALGAAAAQGSEAAAAVIREYQQAVDEASTSVRTLASTEVEESAAVRAGTSARMAASAELRIFEGNMQGSTRAAGAFLAQLPGMGAAMQAAFPVFGAVALAEVLVQVAGKVHDVYNEYVNLYSLQQSVIKNVLEDETTEISLSNQRLAQLREQRILAAELQGPRQGRSNRGAAAGATFDTHIDTVDLQNAQGLLAQTTQRINELTKASQTYQTISNGRLITVQTDDMRRAAALLPQLREDAQKYSDTIETLQQKMQTDEMRTALMNKESNEKTTSAPSSNRVQQAIEQQRIIEEGDKRLHEVLQANWEADYRAQEEAYRKGEEADRERTELFKKNQEEMRNANLATLATGHEQTVGGLESKESAAQSGAAIGLTDPQKTMALLKSLHEQALAEDQAYYAKAIQLAEGDADKQEQLSKQLAEKIQKDQLQIQKDQEKLLQEQVQNYKKAYQEITQDLNSAINKIVIDGQKPGLTFAKMLNQMLSQLATFIEQYLEKKAEMWVLDEVLGKTSQTAAATTTITSNAAVAASGAFAATAGIPIVGPALAPAAAATAFSQTISFLGLAAFEQGGIVNGSHGMPVPIMAHAGERVLTAGQTSKFDSMVNSSTSASSSSHLTYAPQIHAYDKSGMKSILQSHSADIHAIVKSGYKSGALGRA